MGRSDVLVLLLLVASQVICAPDVQNLPEDGSSVDLDSPLLSNQYTDEYPSDSPLQLQDLDDRQFEELSNFLIKLLLVPWPNGVSPLLYVETPKEVSEQKLEESDFQDYDVRPNELKRSKYYRKFPYKRQNSRYEPDNQYMCAPSKHDVMRLLVALHDSRVGNREKLVDFCRRRRPAAHVFTNVRFLGKKK